MPNIIRRLGASPEGRSCDRNFSCPDVLLLDDGDIAAIGRNADQEIYDQLPALGASVGEDETLVVIPGEVYRSSVASYVRGLPSEEVVELFWPGLKQAAAELLRQWVESVRRLIAAWMARARIVRLAA